MRWDKHKTENYYDEDRQTTYKFPPPQYTVAKWYEAEYMGDSYIHPRDRWAQENEQTEMPTWMLDMLVVDGQSASRPNQKKSVIQLQREADYYKARALHLQSEREDREEYHTNRLAGTKRKYDEIKEENEAEIKQLKQENAQL